MSDDRRLPDFIVVGAMKSATSSLFYWLGGLPAVSLPKTKEPDFFSVEARWTRGIEWYSSLFPDGASITGEASTSYTDPDRAELVADRIKVVVPRARLICVLREPIERLRSHYRHEVQRGRERRTLVEAAVPTSPYVRRSLYDAALRPYLARFEPNQLCVVRTEDFDDDGAGWRVVLEHLGLADDAERPRRPFNVTGTKEQFSRPALALFERGRLRAPAYLPRSLRRIARRTLLRDSSAYRDLLASSDEPLLDATIHEVSAATERLRDMMGLAAPLWDT